MELTNSGRSLRNLAEKILWLGLLGAALFFVGGLLLTVNSGLWLLLLVFAMVAALMAFSTYVIALAMSALGEAAENSTKLVNLMTSESSSSSEANAYDPLFVLTDKKHSAPSSNLTKAAPTSWVCSCGKRNDISHISCPTCGRVPKR